MTFWMRAAAVLVMVTSVSHAISNCSDLKGMSKIKCEAGAQLNRGIDLFEKKDYARAQKYFQRVMQSYPQLKEVVARAKVYKAKCDRLLTRPHVAAKVLTFQPETTHGQILSPGEKPGETTLEESQKDLQPNSSGAAPSSH